ncbi:MAG: mechanosensitive ion channel [Bacteroidetes bacterium]|nr:mechanosensitive ion channel [Bacteroidota bacterium]
MDAIGEFLNFKLFTYNKSEILVLDVAESVLIILLAYLLLRWIKKILLRAYRKDRLTVGQQFAYYQLSKYFIGAITVILVLASIKVDLKGLWLGSAALLVGVGFGIQQLFNDLLSGFLLLFENTVRVGDIVEVDGMVCRVKEIGIRTSRVKNRDGIVVVLPNSKIVSNSVINWTTESRLTRFTVSVGVAYGSPVDQVRNILLDCAARHNEVSKSPKPICRFVDFGDSSLDFDLLFWSKNNFRIEDVKSDIRFMIDNEFRKQGIRIPFPQRDVHLFREREGDLEE